jgi:hypothetical protein
MLTGFIWASGNSRRVPAGCKLSFNTVAAALGLRTTTRKIARFLRGCWEIDNCLRNYGVEKKNGDLKSIVRNVMHPFRCNFRFYARL